MMMCTSGIDLVNSVEPASIDTYINNAAWANHKTCHKILKASPDAAQLEHDTVFDVSFVAHCGKLENRHCQTDRSNTTIIK